MAKKPEEESSTEGTIESEAPRAFSATRGSRGRVIRGIELTEAEAIAERFLGHDIVICGPDRKLNRALAQRIENAVGPNEPDAPHKKEGPYALPHFHQQSRDPDGHCFYETDRRKAAKNP
jgi:hypothetical protein